MMQIPSVLLEHSEHYAKRVEAVLYKYIKPLVQ